MDGPDRSSIMRVGSWIDAKPRQMVVLAGLAMVMILGWIDYLTGAELAFSIFYLIPVSVIGWKFEFRLAAAVAGLAAMVWIGADVAANESYSSALIPVWNTVTRFGVFLLVVSLIQGLRNALREQAALAQTDALTGVLNARAFHDLAVDYVDFSRREKHPLTFVYIDVDNFKAVNDTLGHSGGDEVLRAIGRALVGVTRSTDLVARLGGDEFALLLPATGSEDAKRVMTALLGRVYTQLDGLGKTVSFSAGAVTFLVPPNDIDHMVNTADNLMYEAKRSGKASHRHITVGSDAGAAVEDRSAPRVVVLDTDPMPVRRGDEVAKAPIAPSS